MNVEVKYSEISKIVHLLDKRKPIDVILSVAQAKLLQRHMNRLGYIPKKYIFFDFLCLFFLQIRIAFTWPQIGLLSQLYDPDRLDHVVFYTQEDNSVRVTFLPFAN